jgi:WASH complex subunit 7
MSAFETETATKRPIDEHVQNTLLFIQKHESILQNINAATRITPMASSDNHARPIRMATESFERVLPQDLIFTDNEHVRKSVTVLVFLCDEISQLKEIAETRFFRPLLMFGQNPPDAVDFEKSKKPKKAEEPLFDQPGMKEKMIGKFLPFLQELSNFIDRCYSVCLNLVQQLASLMDNKELLYRCMFSSMHLTSVFKQLGELLTVLISLDAIVQHNENLQDAWSAYKSMISLARNDVATFNTSTEEIAKFERLLVSVDQAIMINEIFKGCIEQNFESAIEDDSSVTPINVRNNVNFMTGEMLFCMKQIIENSVPVMGTQSELNERTTIMGCVGMYALYRQLLPPNQYPDAKLHKTIWGIQKIVPFVVVCETVMWTVGKLTLFCVRKTA